MINASPQLLDEAESRGSIKDAGPKDRRHDEKCIRVLKGGFSLHLAGSARDAETPRPGNRRLDHVDDFGIEWIDNRNSRRNHFCVLLTWSSWSEVGTTVFPLRDVAVKSID
jgi:hypothetical protein